MKYRCATQFDICQMTNRTDLYNNWTSIYNTPRMKKINNCIALAGFELTNLVVIGTDCTGSC